jgi:hypothetical protein
MVTGERPTVPPRVSVVLVALGLVEMALAAAANERTVSWLVGFELLPSGAMKVRAAQAVLGCLGLLTVALRRSEAGARIQMVLLGSALAAPVMAEITIRIAIAAGIPSLRDPGLYADYFSDDEYFRLKAQWGQPLIRSDWAHPQLGWAPPRDAANPLGIIRPGPYRVVRHRPILFYGDSYVAGATGPDDTISHHLESNLPGRTVYNFGVGGYGLDQILLRIENTHSDFSQPTILVGLLMEDIDRCVLRFRGAPKPYFELAGDQLSLKGIPVSADFGEWLSRDSVRTRSYLGALVQRRLEVRRLGRMRAETSRRRSEKERLASRVLERLVGLGQREDVPLHFVLFYAPYDLCYEGWRERFVKRELDRLGATYLDTKPALLDASGGTCDPSRHYLSDGHFTGEGNAFIARLVATSLFQRTHSDTASSG